MLLIKCVDDRPFDGAVRILGRDGVRGLVQPKKKQRWEKENAQKFTLMPKLRVSIVSLERNYVGFHVQLKFHWVSLQCISYERWDVRLFDEWHFWYFC